MHSGNKPTTGHNDSSHIKLELIAYSTSVLRANVVVSDTSEIYPSGHPDPYKHSLGCFWGV